MKVPTAAVASPLSGAWSFAVLLFLLVAAHALLETARDSIFLRTQPLSSLPWVYLAVAAAVLVVTPAQAWLMRRKSGALAMGTTLLVASGLTLGFWAVARRPFAVNAFYVWTAIFSSLVFSQFWLGPAEAFDAARAKRVFGFIGGGGLVGAVAGSATAKVVLGFAPPRVLLLVSAALTVCAALVAVAWRCPTQQAGSAVPEVAVLQAVPREAMDDSYLRLLTVLALVPALAATLVDYVFKSTVATQVLAKNIPAVVADAYIAQSVVALGVEVFAVRFLLGSEGVTRSLFLLPVALLAGVTGFAVAGTVLLATCLKIVDGGLRPSLYRVSTELLYVPIPPAKRRLLKPSIDTVGQRAGQSVAAVFLAMVQSLAIAPVLAALGIAGAALGWVQVIRALRSRYVQLFRNQLARGRPASAALPKLDLAVTETLVGALGSADSHEVITAMELLAGYGRPRLVSALILYHPDAAVARAAMEHFEGTERPDVDALLPFLLKHADESVRAAAVRRWSAAGRAPEDLLTLAQDPNSLVRASALVALSGTSPAVAPIAKLEAVAMTGTVTERRALARAIADAPRPDLSPVLEKLFDCPDLETRREVVRSARKLVLDGAVTLVPRLGELLAEPELRSVTRDALVALGAPALDWLAAQMRSSETRFQLARELPDTVARFPPQAATPILLERLASRQGGLVRYRALRALNQLRRENPKLLLSNSGLETALSIELSAIFKNRALRLAASRFGAAGDGPAGPLLLAMLEGKELLAVERMFRVLQLMFPRERLEHVFLAFRSRRPDLRGAAEEVLFELLRAPWREAALAVLEPDGLAGVPVRAPWTQTELERPEFFVSALLGHSSEMLRVLAAYLASERDWVETIPDLQAAAQTMGQENRELIEEAISHLAQPGKKLHG
jgi:ATP/ADP translocase/HEAT repeat protein